MSSAFNFNASAFSKKTENEQLDYFPYSKDVDNDYDTLNVYTMPDATNDKLLTEPLVTYAYLQQFFTKQLQLQVDDAAAELYQIYFVPALHNTAKQNSLYLGVDPDDGSHYVKSKMQIAAAMSNHIANVKAITPITSQAMKTKFLNILFADFMQRNLSEVMDSIERNILVRPGYSQDSCRNAIVNFPFYQRGILFSTVNGDLTLGQTSMFGPAPASKQLCEEILAWYNLDPEKALAGNVVPIRHLTAWQMTQNNGDMLTDGYLDTASYLATLLADGNTKIVEDEAVTEDEQFVKLIGGEQPMDE